MSFNETEVGKIPEYWNIKTVEELVKDKILDKPLDGNHGGIHPKGSDFIEEGIPFIMASDIKGREIDFSSCKFISEEQANSLKKGFAKEGDILITHKATIGLSAIVKNIDTDFIILTPQVTYYRVLDYKKLDNLFLLYYFKYEGFKKLFENWAGGGSTRLYLGITNQRKLPIVLPQVEEQKIIAKILSDLDNKIEVNNKINQRLEDMAQSIFKHWFVDFEFPNEEGNPYKSSGGEMVESELGMIPKGWEVKELGEIGNIITGKTPSAKDEDGFGEEYNFITPRDINNSTFILETERQLSSMGAEKLKRNKINKNSIGVSCIGSNLGEVYITGEDSFTNQQINSIILSDEKIYPYVYIYLKNMKNDFLNMSSGSAVPIINKTSFSGIDIVIPKQEVLYKFSQIITDNFNMIRANLKEIDRLSNLRDTLLPKLMSGEIRVPINKEI